MAGYLSLTKHYVFERLVADIASLRPGMTIQAVGIALSSPHKELADDIFSYDGGRLLDSLLLQTCRSRSPLAKRVLWVSLIAADSRLPRVLKAMSQPDGRLDQSQYATSQIESLLATEAAVFNRKAASNLARYFEQAEILVPKRRGSEIVGVIRPLDTEDAVPICVAHLAEVFAWADPPQGAVDIGVHTWLNLEADRLVSLASGDGVTSRLRLSAVTAPIAPAVVGDRTRLPYVDQDVEAGIAAPQRRQDDSEAIENATREHRITQNLLADWARNQGFDTVRPNGEPLFDVGWWKADDFFVAEVKSLGVDNEARQVRLGIGQVLDYRKQLRDSGTEATAVLAVSRQPSSEYWAELASELGILFCWPPFETLDA